MQSTPLNSICIIVPVVSLSISHFICAYSSPVLINVVHSSLSLYVYSLSSGLQVSISNIRQQLAVYYRMVNSFVSLKQSHLSVDCHTNNAYVICSIHSVSLYAISSRHHRMIAAIMTIISLIQAESFEASLQFSTYNEVHCCIIESGVYYVYINLTRRQYFIGEKATQSMEGATTENEDDDYWQ